MENSVTEMLMTSLGIMVTGMIIVFTFLMILIFAVNMTAKIIKSLKLEAEINDSAQPAAPRNNKSGNIKPETIAAISAAVKKHKE